VVRAFNDLDAELYITPRADEERTKAQLPSEHDDMGWVVGSTPTLVSFNFQTAKKTKGRCFMCRQCMSGIYGCTLSPESLGGSLSL